MRVILRQTFPLGRFHANPWRAFPFEDPHGEWPPSPWRLLRAILARSHQYERECGVEGTGWREQTVRALCASRISWNLPPFSWRGPGLRQYQPAVFTFDPPGKKNPREKKYKSTLTRDNFWIIGAPGRDAGSNVIWWSLEGTEWSRDLFDWFDASLERMTYFGRAESLTEIRRVENVPPNTDINCLLEDMPSSGAVPVLAPTPDATLEQLQSFTDDPSIVNSTVPPGAQWLYAKRPARPPIKLLPLKPKAKKPMRVVQFAIGARFSPPRKSIVVLTQRFRGRAIREFLGASWQRANMEQRKTARLLTGKESDGKPLQDHQHSHARFGILFDKETNKATRLIIWRNQPFIDAEQQALMKAAERELHISFVKAKRKGSWTIRLLPLDSQVPPPCGFDGKAYTHWQTVTPYVPPRHVYDRRGRIKLGEKAEEQIRRELSNIGFDIEKLIIEVNNRETEWIQIHKSRQHRNHQTNTEKRGYHISLTFNTPVQGPIALGNSSHFGLGLFVPASIDTG